LERVHAVENFDLLLDRRVADRRRLQAVAKRLVVQHRDGTRAGGVVIPVVNQRVGRNAQGATLRCGFVLAGAVRELPLQKWIADNPMAIIAAAEPDAVHSARVTAGRIHWSMSSKCGGADGVPRTASSAAT